jgi:hypothetical protein
MEILNSVVCGIDGSKASIHACETVMARMEPGQALLAVAVLPQEPMAYDATAEMLERLEQEIAHQAKRLGHALGGVEERAKSRGLSVTTVLDREGRPYDRILERAQEAKAGVVVMGAKHHNELQRRLVGSTASRVVGLGACNVLMVPENADLQPDGPIIAPTDGSSHGLAAVRLAADLARESGRSLIVLGVADVPGGAEDEPMSQLGADILAEGARKHAEAGAKAVSGVEAEVAVRTGKAFEQIANLVRERSAGLVVMGSHGRTGLTRLLMGSNTERVLETAPCPVLVTK